MKTATVRVEMAEFRPGWKRGNDAFYFAGHARAVRSIANRVELGPGVEIVEGGFPESGGEEWPPPLNPFRGTVLEIVDVPANHADLADPAVMILDRAIAVENLRAERARLMARITEIDNELAE